MSTELRFGVHGAFIFTKITSRDRCAADAESFHAKECVRTFHATMMSSSTINPCVRVLAFRAMKSPWICGYRFMLTFLEMLAKTEYLATAVLRLTKPMHAVCSKTMRRGFFLYTRPLPIVYTLSRRREESVFYC